MSRIIDYISGGLILFLIGFALSMLATSSVAISVIFSIALCFAVLFSIYYFSSLHKKPYSCDRLELELCMRGNEYAINLLKSVIKNAEFENCSEYIPLKNSVIIANFKFSPLSYADVGSACKIAAKNKKSKIYLLAKSIDRRAYQIAALQGIELELVKTKVLFKYLARHNALPQLTRQRHKLDIRLVIEAVLSRRNLKSYIFTGIVLICVAFLTPLKIYYLVFGSIALMLALLCLTPLGNGSISSPKVFNELEKEIHDNKNEISN